MRPLSALLFVGLSALASAAGYQMTSGLQGVGQTQPLLAWCDAPQSVYALTRSAGKGTLYEWPKAGGERVQTVKMGEGDGAAGSVFYPFNAGKLSGHVRMSNIENTLDPAYRMTHVGEFAFGGVAHRCRYVSDAAFMGVTGKRTVIIWHKENGATYATYNFNGKRGVKVAGQKLGQGWAFTAPQGYRYRVVREAGLWRLDVWRGNRRLQSELFRAYSLSLPK